MDCNSPTLKVLFQMNQSLISILPWFCRCVALCVLILPIGCTYEAPQRSDRANLTGKATYQGTAMQGGSVRAVSTQDDSLGASGVINTDGSFTLQNVPLGPIKISVSTRGMKEFDPDHFIEIPSKYADPETSGITADIKAGETNTIEIKLE
jgi:hypothetical protein